MAFTFAGRWDDEFSTRSGRSLGGASVTVYQSDGVTLATLYTGRTKAATSANPFTCDAQGNGGFFADPGDYRLKVVWHGRTVLTVTDLPASRATVHEDGAESDAHGIDVTKSPYNADPTGLSDVSAAITSSVTATGSVGDLLLPKGTYLVNTDLILPIGIRIIFAKGAVIKVGSGKTLTLRGPIDAGMHQIFDANAGTGSPATGTVRFDGSAANPPGVIDVYPQWWGAVGDNATDSTIALQQSIYAAGRGVARLRLGSGRWIASQLVVPGATWISGDMANLHAAGTGTGATLKQKAGTNDDFIIFEAGFFDGSRYFVAEVQIENLLLRGDSTATAGSGICLRDAAGAPVTVSDQFRLQNLEITGFAEDGIEFRDGALPTHLRDIRLFDNGGYGINYVVATYGVEITQSVHFDNVSGDANLLGLIRVAKADGNGNILITNLKSEKRINATRAGSQVGQRSVIVIEDSDCTLHIEGATSISSVPDGSFHEVPENFIKVIGTRQPFITWENVAIRVRSGDTGTALAMLDAATGATMPYTVTKGGYGSAARQVAYLSKNNATLSRVFGAGSYQGASDPGNARAQVAGLTPARTFYETDAAADEKAWGIFVSGGALTMRTLTDAGVTVDQFMRVLRSGGAVASLFLQHLIAEATAVGDIPLRARQFSSSQSGFLYRNEDVNGNGLSGWNSAGICRLPDGAVGGPGMGFNADTNCGWYRIGSDDWAAASGGVKHVELTNVAGTLTAAISGTLLEGTGSVAAATSVTLPMGNVITITGNTNIDTIVATGNAGRTVKLIFTGTPTVNDGTGNLKMAGNFSATADDTLSLVCDGTSWFETGRSVN